MALNRFLILLALVAATCTLSLIGGSSLPSSLSVTAAHADACNQSGDPQWPNCATVCAVTGNQCDQGSDGDVDYGWICSAFGDDCPGDGGGGGECGDGSALVGTNGDGAVSYVDDDGAFHQIPDGDTFDAMGFSWGDVVWCDSLPDPPIGMPYPSIHNWPTYSPWLLPLYNPTKPDLREFDQAVATCEWIIGRSLRPDEKSQLHDEIHGMGLSYHGIVAECVAMFR